VRDSDVGGGFVRNGVPCEDFRQHLDAPIDEQAHVISADLVALRRRIDALAPPDNLVGAAEDEARVTPAGKDMLVHLFCTERKRVVRYRGFEFIPLHHPVSKFSDISENRSKIRARARDLR
jgi:hypothetical protein